MLAWPPALVETGPTAPVEEHAAPLGVNVTASPATGAPVLGFVIVAVTVDVLAPSAGRLADEVATPTAYWNWLIEADPLCPPVASHAATWQVPGAPWLDRYVTVTGP